MSSQNIHIGKNIILWSSINGDIAAQDSATFNINNELIELAANSDGFRRYTTGKKDATISLSGLLLINPELFEVDYSIKSLFDVITRNVNEDFFIRYEITQTGEKIEIPVLITSFVLNGDSTGYATYSAEFKGNGTPIWS